MLTHLTNPNNIKSRKRPSDVRSDESDELTHFSLAPFVSSSLRGEIGMLLAHPPLSPPLHIEGGERKFCTSHNALIALYALFSTSAFPANFLMRVPAKP